MKRKREALTGQAIGYILGEREKQDKKWGVQRHSWPEWISILGEEFGEACQAVLHLRFPNPDWTVGDVELRDALRTELVQTAAVAVAIIEHIDELKETHDAVRTSK